MVIDQNGNSISRPIIAGKPPITRTGPAATVQKRQSVEPGAFESILRQKIADATEIKFSKHAQERLLSRNINLTDEQKMKMKEAVAKAESKGVRDSLVLMDNLAFVVNIRNKTVITAVHSNELSENVFTNIDGAVII